jgi:probable rRNA maturation factor
MNLSRPSLSQHPLASVELQINPIFVDLVPASLLTTAVDTTLRHLGREDGEVTLVIGDDTLLQQLNYSYRQIDSPTDVLSFSVREDSDTSDVAFVSAPEAERYLGDVVISLPAAQRQAGEGGHRLEEELCLLAVHGVLHLLGYDHATADEETVMESLQKDILATLGVHLP